MLARGPRVALRRPTTADADVFCAAVARSEALHGQWVFPPRNPTAFELWIEATRRPNTEAHLVTSLHDELLGVVNINNIVRGSLLSGALGYYGFIGSEGSGLVRDGVALVMGRAFGELGLHRLEANIQPGNEPSRRLVASLGFVHEGFSEAYLRIGGQWRDHDRYAVLNHDV